MADFPVNAVLDPLRRQFTLHAAANSELLGPGSRLVPLRSKDCPKGATISR
jgi:hypothetical protein